MGRNEVAGDDGFPERVVDFGQRPEFPGGFFFVGEGVSRLNIVSDGAEIANKIHFELLPDEVPVLVLFSDRKSRPLL